MHLIIKTLPQLGILVSASEASLVAILRSQLSPEPLRSLEGVGLKFDGMSLWMSFELWSEAVIISTESFFGGDGNRRSICFYTSFHQLGSDWGKN